MPITPESLGYDEDPLPLYDTSNVPGGGVPGKYVV
jgi:hypothetical protein